MKPSLQCRRIGVAGAALALAAALASPPPASAQKWIPLGPTSIRNAQTFDGRAPATGRINVVAPNPQNPLGDIWIGSATGGVWHGSVSPFNYWTPMTDDAPSLAVGAIALDGCDATRCRDVWVGTGENSIRRDTQYGQGVLKGTWSDALGRYEWETLGRSHFKRGNITRLLLDRYTSGEKKVVFAALSSGVTSNATHSTVTTEPPGAYGIWKSEDAGQTWNNIFAAGGPATDLEADPIAPNILFAGIRGAGLFRSVDGGDHWQEVLQQVPDSEMDWPEIAVFRNVQMIHPTVYAVVGKCKHPHQKSFPFGCSPKIYRSTDGGDVWTQVSSPPGESVAYLSYTHALAVHPSNPDVLWYGGVNLFKSSDGGQSWGDPPVGDRVHPDHHQVVPFLSGKSSTGLILYDVSDGGFFVGDGAGGWRTDFQDGLEVTQFQSVSVDPARGLVFGGTQDNGINATLSGWSVWEHLNDGDGASTDIDRDDPFILYGVEVGGADGAIPVRCSSPGLCKFNWLSIKTNDIPDPAVVDASWYAPLLQNPAPVGGQHPLFFATQDLWRSDNDGGSWTSLTAAAPVPSLPEPELNGTLTPVTAVAVSPSDSNRIYLGYYDGTVLTTANGLAASPVWTRIDHGLPDRPVTSIAVHPTDPARAYLSLSGFGDHSVYYTQQASSPWIPFSNSADPDDAFARNPVNVLVFEPTSPYTLWAGTDDGVYQRVNPVGGQLPWTRDDQGLPRVAVYDLEITPDGTEIYAGTHGRGVWVRSAGLKPGKLDWVDCCGEIDYGKPYLPVVGTGFDPGQSCTLTLLEGGRVCSAGATDADGAALSTDARGFLVASKPGYYTSRRLGFACLGGACAGGVPASRCAVTEVRVSCGTRTLSAAVRRPAEGLDPSGTRLGLQPAGGGTLSLSAVLQKAGGPPQALCAQTITLTSGDDDARALRRLADGLNSDPRCQQAGVEARVTGSRDAGKGEDDWPEPFRLILEAPTQTGVQLVTEASLSGAGGLAVEGFGDPRRGPVASQVVLSGTAAGGRVRVTEVSPAGSCAVAVDTATGDTADAVAARVQDAFLARGEEPAFSLEPGCLPLQSSRDVTRSGAVLSFGLGRHLEVSSTDPGLIVRVGGVR
jgi:hypothetical protein